MSDEKPLEEGGTVWEMLTAEQQIISAQTKEDLLLAQQRHFDAIRNFVTGEPGKALVHSFETVVAKRIDAMIAAQTLAFQQMTATLHEVGVRLGKLEKRQARLDSRHSKQWRESVKDRADLRRLINELAERFDGYIAAVPLDRRNALVAQIEEHERRLNDLDVERGGDGR